MPPRSERHFAFLFLAHCICKGIVDVYNEILDVGDVLVDKLGILVGALNVVVKVVESGSCLFEDTNERFESCCIECRISAAECDNVRQQIVNDLCSLLGRIGGLADLAHRTYDAVNVLIELVGQVTALVGKLFELFVLRIQSGVTCQQHGLTVYNAVI